MLQLQPANKINWPELYMVAEAAKEPFADVRIVTAKSEFVRLAGDVMFATSSSISNKVMQTTIDALDVAVQESVTISLCGDIDVVMNADTIDDDDATWRALDMVASAIDQLDGYPGTVKFGEPITFKSNEIPWLSVS